MVEGPLIQRLEDLFYSLVRGDSLSREQTVTGEEESGVLIGDREREAVEAIAGLELAFEVGCPQIIRSGSDCWNNARVAMRRPPMAAPLDQSAPRKQVCRGARGRPPAD